jgi:hypothetical protein
MEAWLEVAQGLLETVEEKVTASNSEAAAKICWLVERVWKLLISNMDLLQIMDPDDFMQLKHELAINTSSQLGVDTSVEHIGAGKNVLYLKLFFIIKIIVFVKFWDNYYTIIYYTHCQEQMKSVGSHGSSSMPFVMKVMV